MPPIRAIPSSSSDLPIQRTKRSARNISPHERSDSSNEEEGDSNENGVDVITAPATIPPLEATNSQPATGEGVATILQAVHLIKGLNAEEIAILRTNRQQFAAYNRTKDFPLNMSFPNEHMHEIGLFVASHERMWPKGISP